MVICHLGNVDVEGLFEEDTVALISDCGVIEEILDDAANFDYGHGCAVDELHVRHPLVLELVLEFAIHLSEDGLGRMLLLLPRHDDQVYVRPGQTKLRRVGPVDLDLAVG